MSCSLPAVKCCIILVLLISVPGCKHAHFHADTVQTSSAIVKSWQQWLCLAKEIKLLSPSSNLLPFIIVPTSAVFSDAYNGW